LRAAGIDAQLFLPMHVPVLLAGFLVGPGAGLIVGLLAPSAAQLVNGVSPDGMIPLESLELSLYGLVAGLAYCRLRLNIFVALVVSLVVGRLMFGLGLLVLGLITTLPYTAAQFFSADGPVVSGLPGIVIQLVLIPFVVASMRRRRN
jgi:niacin transporter